MNKKIKDTKRFLISVGKNGNNRIFFVSYGDCKNPVPVEPKNLSDYLLAKWEK